MDIDQSVDVVIPVYRPGKELEKLLYWLDRQTVSVRNVFIMHTREEEKLSLGASFRFHTVVEEISPQEYDHGGTRDRAMQKSTGKIIVCMTQDAVPENEYLIENLIQPLADEDIAVSYARQMPKTECKLLERYTRSFNYPAASRVKSSEDLDTLGIKTYFCSNVCAAYNREIYVKTGGFEKKTIFNEDMLYAAKCIRQGYKVAYAGDAKVIHSHNYTRRQQFSRNFDIAVSQKEHPEVFAGIKSEQEGIKMVKRGIRFLIRNHTPWMMVPFVLDSAAKYLGYLLGKNYKKLPLAIVKKCSMNPRYWQEKESV